MGYSVSCKSMLGCKFQILGLWCVSMWLLSSPRGSAVLQSAQIKGSFHQCYGRSVTFAKETAVGFKVNQWGTAYFIMVDAERFVQKVTLCIQRVRLNSVFQILSIRLTEQLSHVDFFFIHLGAGFPKLWRGTEGFWCLHWQGNIWCNKSKPWQHQGGQKTLYTRTQKCPKEPRALLNYIL